MSILTAPPITLEQYASFKSPAGFRDELIEGEIIMQMPQDHSMPSPDIFVIDIKRWKAALEANGYPQ